MNAEEKSIIDFVWYDTNIEKRCLYHPSKAALDTQAAACTDDHAAASMHQHTCSRQLSYNQPGSPSTAFSYFLLLQHGLQTVGCPGYTNL